MSENNPGQVTVVYVGNSGFLVTIGKYKILVDGIFSGFPPKYTQPSGVVELITDAKSPFDNIDLLLVSHAHEDHFNPGRVRDYLDKNPRAMVISTGEAVEGLLSIPKSGERIFAVTLAPGESREQTVNGIRVAAYSLSHGYNKEGVTIPNLGFLAAVNGVSFFHSGDMDTGTVKVTDLKKLGLPDEQIDIAFLPHWLFRSATAFSYATRGVAARHYIPIHYHYTIPRMNADLIARIVPDAILFKKELDSWKMP